MSITIKKIAELANVSRGTVDRVIHNRGGVNEETSERVKAIMKKYNYKSNRIAQALVTSKKRYSVGVIINSIGNEFFDSILEGLVYEKQKYNNIDLIIKELKGYDENDQLKAIEEIVNEDIQALIITPINTENIINALNKLDIPVVTMNNDIEVDKLAFVGCDYYNSGQLSGDIANIALPNGGNVAIVVGSFNLRGHVERINGFKEVFKAQNGKIKTFENQDDDNISYDLVKEIVKNKKIDLFYFAAAGIAGGLKALEELKSNIPVITVDETKAAREGLLNGRTLATITQQPYKQGSRAIQIIQNYLVYNTKPENKENITGNKIQLRHMRFVVDK